MKGKRDKIIMASLGNYGNEMFIKDGYFLGSILKIFKDTLKTIFGI